MTMRMLIIGAALCRSSPYRFRQSWSTTAGAQRRATSACGMGPRASFANRCYGSNL
jgi:hypothetical protein